MWKMISDEKDIERFMNEVCGFHDSCIKEMKYVSGAYVDEGLRMHPVNDCRRLHVIIQRQYAENAMIEMVFEGLKCLRLSPCDDKYTCEILDATIVLRDDCIFWLDCGGVSETDFDKYDGTLICAEKLRWRAMDGHMGPEDFYPPIE